MNEEGIEIKPYHFYLCKNLGSIVFIEEISGPRVLGIFVGGDWAGEYSGTWQKSGKFGFVEVLPEFDLIREITHEEAIKILEENK